MRFVENFNVFKTHSPKVLWDAHRFPIHPMHFPIFNVRSPPKSSYQLVKFFDKTLWEAKAIHRVTWDGLYNSLKKNFLASNWKELTLLSLEMFPHAILNIISLFLLVTSHEGWKPKISFMTLHLLNWKNRKQDILHTVLSIRTESEHGFIKIDHLTRSPFIDFQNLLNDLCFHFLSLEE